MSQTWAAAAADMIPSCLLSDVVSCPSRYLLSLGADQEILNESGEKPVDLIDPVNKELLVLFGLAVDD